MPRLPPLVGGRPILKPGVLDSRALMIYNPSPPPRLSLQVTISMGHRLCPSGHSRIRMRRRSCRFSSGSSGLSFQKGGLAPREGQAVDLYLAVLPSLLLGAYFQKYFSRWTPSGLGLLLDSTLSCQLIFCQ